MTAEEAAEVKARLIEAVNILRSGVYRCKHGHAIEHVGCYICEDRPREPWE